MSKISIVDLEVFINVGVTDEERAQPQRLLLTLLLDFDFTSAAVSDRITKTIDYHAVARMLLHFGEGRSWKIIEKLANDIADKVLMEFQPQAITVEVKKFPIPQAAHVSVSLSKNRAGGALRKTAWGIP